MDRSGRGLGPTRGEAEGPNWRAVHRGLYLPTETDCEVVEQRIVNAAALLPGDHSGITGWAALRWLGGRWFTGVLADGTPRPVPSALGTDIRPQRGILICEEGLGPESLATHDGLRITTAVRSVCFEMRYATDLREAVTGLDMAAYSGLVSIDEARTYAAALSGWTGIPQCRQAIEYAVENSWSPMETRTRLVWLLDAGLPPPVCNMPVFDDVGRHVATPDLLDREAGLAVEYDGRLHLEGRQRARDVRREEALRDVGLECLTVLAGDVSNRHGLAARMRAAHVRARRRSESRRAWTVDPPAWWVATDTVAARRALTDAQRLRWLAHRVA